MNQQSSLLVDYFGLDRGNAQFKVSMHVFMSHEVYNAQQFLIRLFVVMEVRSKWGFHYEIQFYEDVGFKIDIY